MTKIFLLVFGMLDTGEMAAGRHYHASIEICEAAKQQIAFIYAPANMTVLGSYCVEAQ